MFLHPIENSCEFCCKRSYKDNNDESLYIINSHTHWLKDNMDCITCQKIHRSLLSGASGVTVKYSPVLGNKYPTKV